MQARSFLTLVMAILFGGWVTSALWAQPDTMMLKSPFFQARERPPVPFPHSRHMEGGGPCMDCHHRYEGKKNILEEGDLEPGKPGIRCQECHGSKGRVPLREVFHRQCTGCHKKSQKEGKKTAPLYCGECHRKR